MEKTSKMRCTFSTEFKKEKVLFKDYRKLKVSEVNKVFKGTSNSSLQMASKV